MGLTRTIVSAAAAHRGRSLKEYMMRRGDILVAAWLSAVLLVRFTVNAVFAARTLAAGSLSAGHAICRFCTFNVLLDGFLLSFLFSMLAAGPIGLERRRIGLSPAPFPAFFLSQLAVMAANPMSWTVAPLLLPAILPLARMPDPAAGIATLILGFAGVFMLAWALGSAVSLLPAAAKAGGLFRVAFPVLLAALVLANFSFKIEGGAVILSAFQKAMPLGDGGVFGGKGTPWAWVMSAALGSSPAPRLLAAGASAAAALCLYALLLRLSLLRIHGALHPRAARFIRVDRARAGTLSRLLFFKESSESLCSARALVAAAAGIGTAVWLLASKEVVPILPLLGAFVVLTSAFPAASNSFGADGAAVKRYMLAATDWGRLLMARNLTYACTVFLPIVVIALAACIRVSSAQGLALLLTAAFLLLVQLCWGNLSSILLPAASASPSRGTENGFVNQVFPVLIWGIPLLVNGSAPYGSVPYTAVMAGMLAAAGVTYVVLMRAISRRFVSEVEKMLERMG
jgi:hypothetical protein